MTSSKTIEKKLILSIMLAVVLVTTFISIHSYRKINASIEDQKVEELGRFWEIQSVDTMKYSRDTARGETNNIEFEQEIDNQVKAIAELGATHVAIGTPYDDEFIPFMEKWVKAARKHNLNVWFRGNWSGWEGWFEYPSITKEEHLAKTQSFILTNPELFEDGDIFTPCPECENGAIDDPRTYGSDEKVREYRKFLVDLMNTSNAAFVKTNKEVNSGYFSMNGDVAQLIMDKDTTGQLNNNIVVDHYVNSPNQLDQDITKYAKEGGGNVILGEFGAPIPDIHGDMTQQQQADWLEQTLQLLSENKSLTGLNYWTFAGGSTELWKDGKPTIATQIIKKYFKPNVAKLYVLNELDEPIENSTAKNKTKLYTSRNSDQIIITTVESTPTIVVSAPGYESKILQLPEGSAEIEIVLKKTNEDFIFKLRKLIKKMADQASNNVGDFGLTL